MLNQAYFLHICIQKFTSEAAKQVKTRGYRKTKASKEIPGRSFVKNRQIFYRDFMKFCKLIRGKNGRFVALYMI